MSGSYRGVANTYTVFEPEQIHILGNKQDIAGFKKFVNAATTQPSTNPNQNDINNLPNINPCG
jgi:hypothetical protein